MNMPDSIHHFFMSYPIVFYDGVCGFCNRLVQTIIAHDRSNIFRFAPLQSSLGQALIRRHPHLSGIDSVVLLEMEDGIEIVSIKSDAAIRIAAKLGGIWRIFLLARFIPVSIRNSCYDLFARNRYRLFGKRDSCMIPSKEIRERFLDL